MNEEGKENICININIQKNIFFGFEKYGYFELNKKKSKSLLKFNCEKKDKNIKCSHVYLIVVNMELE